MALVFHKTKIMSVEIIDLLPQLEGQCENHEGTPQIIICNAKTLQKLSRSRVQNPRDGKLYNPRTDIGALNGIEIITSPEILDEEFRIF